MGDPEQDAFLAGRDDEQAAVGQMVDTHGKGLDARDDLARAGLAMAVDTQGDDLARAPVGYPQTAIAPPG